MKRRKFQSRPTGLPPPAKGSRHSRQCDTVSCQTQLNSPGLNRTFVAAKQHRQERKHTKKQNEANNFKLTCFRDFVLIAFAMLCSASAVFASLRSAHFTGSKGFASRFASAAPVLACFCTFDFTAAIFWSASFKVSFTRAAKESSFASSPCSFLFFRDCSLGLPTITPFSSAFCPTASRACCTELANGGGPCTLKASTSSRAKTLTRSLFFFEVVQPCHRWKTNKENQSRRPCARLENLVERYSCSPFRILSSARQPVWIAKPASPYAEHLRKRFSGSCIVAPKGLPMQGPTFQRPNASDSKLVQKNMGILDGGAEENATSDFPHLPIRVRGQSGNPIDGSRDPPHASAPHARYLPCDPPHSDPATRICGLRDPGPLPPLRAIFSAPSFFPAHLDWSCDSTCASAPNDPPAPLSDSPDPPHVSAPSDRL